MTRKIHGLMEQTQHLDSRVIAILADPEHHEMTTIVAVASDMQRKYPLCNVITVPCANDSRPAGQ